MDNTTHSVILRTMKPRELPECLLSDKEAKDRFWSHVDRRGPKECWLWNGGSTASKGFRYGVWEYYGIPWKAHRIAYFLKKGAIPEGLTLDHVKARGCESKLCCNPAHLEPVTQSVNTLRQYSDPGRLYALVCARGHAKEFGRVACRKCSVLAVARSQAKKPEKYREMKRLQKQRERARI